MLYSDLSGTYYGVCTICCFVTYCRATVKIRLYFKRLMNMQMFCVCVCIYIYIKKKKRVVTLWAYMCVIGSLLRDVTHHLLWVMLQILLVYILCASNNNVSFKITIWLMIDWSLSNFDQMMILKATPLLEGHKSNW
jgi:hypothetical protein